MMDHTTILLDALVTEKSERLKADENKYTFKVATGANKIQIRQAVERQFKVHVTRVRVMNQLGKMRRMGVFTGRRPAWKKAIVTLKQGETIESLER